MALLQHTFNYEGEVPFPIHSVNLFFRVPTFEYVTVLRGRRPSAARNHLSEQTVHLNNKLSDTSYEARFPNEFLVGHSDRSLINFYSYFRSISFTGNDPQLLDFLSANIDVAIKDERENLFGYIVFDALYSLSTASNKYKDIVERQAALNASVAFNEAESQSLELELADYVRKNVFLLNRQQFDEAAVQFRAVEPRYNEFAFLLIVSHVTDVSSDRPKIKIAADEFRNFLKAEFEIGSAETIKVLQKILKNELFDFPVSVPEIEAVEIKGTFKIITPGNSPVALNDFKFYDLATEYSIQVPDGNSELLTNSFNWVGIQQAPDNTVPFSFGTILTNFLNSAVTVRVKAYDGSVIWENQYAATNPDLQQLVIEVPLTKPVILSGADEPKPSSGGNKKLSGKVIEISGECELKDITVVVQAKKEGDAIWKVVGSASTDSSGNFSLPYPYGVYVAAQALVSLTPDTPADITLYTDDEHIASRETIADDFLYLLIEGADCESKGEAGEEDCQCHESKKPNRLPSQQDLIRSDSYTQDIGGSCINLSIPNRTLNEYRHKAVVRTSDPDVSNYVLTKDSNGNFMLEGGLAKIVRKPVDLSNPIRWQDAPEDHSNLSIYQAVTVATGHVLHYSVVTKADGYSLGELLYSLPLAPGQKKQIVIFEQTHRLMGSETQRLSQRESLAASLVNEVGITDTIAGNLSESTRGGSSATTAGVSAGLGLAGIVQGIAGVFGVSGGVANANSTAWQNSSRSLSEYFNEQMKNTINQNAQSYREQNASVVTSVEEGQDYGVTAEVIANHNHCHSLTMMYFEVLRHYAIYQELTHVEECLFVPFLMTDFTRENIFKWRDVLALNLLPIPSETYLQPFSIIRSGRQHPLLKGFDAIERIKTNYENVDFPDGAYDDEVINFVTGEIYIYTNLPRPKSKYDRVKSWPLEKKSSWSWPGALIGGILGGPLGFIAGGYLNADGSVKAEAIPIIDEYISVDANFASVPPAQCIRVRKIDANFFEAGGFDKAQWEAYAKILGKDVYEMLNYYFKDRLISEWDSIYYNDIAPIVFERICNNISIGNFSAIDFSTETKYKGNYALMKVNLRGSGSNKKRKDITQLDIVFNNTATLTNDLVTLSVRNVTVRYSTAHYNGILFSGFAGDDLLDGSTLFTPENANEKRNPKKEDAYIAQKLIEHLNSNLEHYNKALLRYLDQDRRYMLLDGFTIETYNDFGAPIGQRSLASVVKNELIGISGNALIMPVAPGYKIDRTFIVEQPIEGPAAQINLLDHYKPLTPVPPYRISIPSKGVFAEAVQGACDACEKVRDNTSQDWEKFKADEPTSINPVTVPVPTVTDWKAAFKDFATPIVNIQNAPPAPAPGAGLAAASELLSKSGIFKDITGLDQNQKNAMQTYLSNQENAKAFAEMAKDIFTMGHNTEHADKIADAIRNSPELSKEEKAQLLKDHFGQVIDAGQSKKAEQESTKNNKPTLTDAAVKAVDEGKPVKATSMDGSGQAASIEIGGGGTNKFRVAGKAVPLVLQGDKDAACWAAAATMMKSWKDGKPYTIQQVLATVPEEYLNKYNNNQPLLPSEKMDFVDALGMTGEPPASYTFDTYVGWMKTYGPLWITVDSDSSTDISAHAKILIGYDGDGTEANSRFVFLDPSTVGEQRQTFAEFLEEYEQTARDNPGDLFIQIVHFKDEIIGEGNAASRSLINYTPALDSTIVINKIEFETIPGVLNWSNATVEHNRNDNGHRASSALIHLVLHETASPVASEATTHGFNGTANTTSHMTLMRNGTVLQFNDLMQIEYHTIGLNTSAIGVEFVNRGWLASPRSSGPNKDTPGNLYTYDHEAIPAKEEDLTPQHLAKFPEGNDFLYCFWGMGFNIYRIPPDTNQLEKEVDLVQWLTTDLKAKLDHLEDQLNFTEATERVDFIRSVINSALPVAKANTIFSHTFTGGGTGLANMFFTIERTWLQVVSYDDVSGIWDFPTANIPAISEQGNKNLFIFSTGWNYLEPANIAGKSGIISHNAVKSNHSDGSFLTLYTWLRLEKSFDSTKSYRLAKSLMTDHFFKASLKTDPNDKKIVILNVDDANLV
ncbi:N-acetylmuramoyl-L-alanine amidase [Pontibacter sp. 172403-2]|uniref:papain-like cysteine protease family protein n=1 Tax=Pontibacter rufus TaxID=2791028 RepID=UPI0018AF5B87|nr:papain-like cysteine protease family protein [Pontibacter sp. 172403-2]MBF9255160.1 N-acetylmuramoyl-L-alanine amidase [Pontibacter sp. 172403-2]